VTQPSWPRVAALKTADAFRAHLTRSNIHLEFDDLVESGPASPLAQPLDVNGVRVGNRFCILPMEGWDGTREGEPSELTTRRWRHFGISGAKLIWGGEAVAVCSEARANPNQLVINERTLPALSALRSVLVDAHVESFGSRAADDLYVGLQLTHSGRFSRPVEKLVPAPLTAYHHPILDQRVGHTGRVLTDEEIDRIVIEFVRAARQAQNIGFQFVDVKHCHGYFAHELLSATHRPGKYGGSLENRTRFMRDIIDGIRAEAPGLDIGVRLSVFDVVPFRKDPLGHGVPETVDERYDYAFGLLGGADTADDMEAALDESRAVLRMLRDRGVKWICVTAGSPYYCPHVQRPALFPPADGYEPPEDPLRGVARHVDATARLKAAFPDLVFVGSGYTYLQEWLPNVGQYAVRHGLTDFVGLGRVALSYPELPADVLSGAGLRRKSICRTFSDCTTGPRLGLVSGCFPLDPFYAAHPDAIRLREHKAGVQT
jgi:2,4-dienoyl-CoA reductase-like NADH-dependent reductase (Old Yellow Enzyme family)